MRSTPKHGRLAVVMTATAALCAALFTPTAANALPPDGPSPDTPGTWSSVSPRQVAAGQTINFSVGGFPAGEIVHIKVNDGNPDVCSASATHGACVIHTQVIGSNGEAHGSLVVPSDLAPGSYWLRFLASEYVDPNNPSAGTRGYTNRGNSDFTIVSGSSGSNSGSSNSGSNSGSGGSGGNSGGTNSGGSGGGSSTAVVPDVGGESSESTEEGGDTSNQSLDEESLVAPTAPPTIPELAEDVPLFATTADGENVKAKLGVDRFGQWVYAVHLPAAGDPVGMGWVAVDSDGQVTVPTPPDGAIYFLDASGEVLGKIVASDTAAQVASGDGTNAQVADDANFPLLGVSALGLAVLLSLGAIIFVVLRRRKRDAA
ncbi:hypothetical protein [Gulosibacter chungangensis]|uniref:LPXTG cell wall anchor domain-containing protein n=1 Tax=Gulosibacter chungangensis TaxID=979746 RepID=A0A7J5BAE1_9MICO|nr:hypothetical protein [Gulosibacter chungangensis]KAB1642745.1 hypothetical protein F8O05_09855 [Gulosibacter chungangensis]